ncbi:MULTISPECIES: hypothetical protein [Ramlibacter]|uniref:Uncharacterized protein n=1 Tax=Ramlibacter pinisoli TaxID=2682844 RepID=A0A6N8IYH9_9BURK|nr:MULTISPECIES: hypothetical protein [Ramlibacter]MBA2961072.1 hypothetical protein [Ramlibacter sp. CGMCC 1.13660]MVQ31016.1 hypothetical protein [Ramlibacter pinisoli]
MPDHVPPDALQIPRFVDSTASLGDELTRAESDARAALRQVTRLRLRGAPFSDFSAAIRQAGRAHSRVEMLQREAEGLR